MIKVDFHTHSTSSPDGGITAGQYKQALDNTTLDCVAITDHNNIEFAQRMQAELGTEKVIVGEEINTKQGEIIGLFLTTAVKPNQDIEKAIKDIKNQGGLVYIPHPFETYRSGISRETIETIKDSIDLVESANGRAFFQNFGPEAHVWARVHNIPVLASSDAHRSSALGRTYSLLTERPAAANLAELAKTARKIYNRPSLLDILAPKLNRLKNTWGKK